MHYMLLNDKFNERQGVDPINNRDGVWHIAPGLAGSLVVPLTGPYVGTLSGSTSIRELIERGLVEVNVGERPFAYPLPAGYRPWGEN